MAGGLKKNVAKVTGNDQKEAEGNHLIGFTSFAEALVFCHSLLRMLGCSLGRCFDTGIGISRRQGQADKGRCQEGSQQVVFLSIQPSKSSHQYMLNLSHLLKITVVE